MNSCPEGLYPYSIQSGDTLWLISQRFFTTVEAIMAANPGLDSSNLTVGQVIFIPVGNRPSASGQAPAAALQQPQAQAPAAPQRPQPQPRTPAAALQQPQSPGSIASQPMVQGDPQAEGRRMFCPRGSRAHTVEAGDTLWKISQRYDTTVDAIMTVNPGIDYENLRIGQRLCIPRGNRNPAAPSTPAVPTPPTPPSRPQFPIGGGTSSACPFGLYPYVIQSGDTLWLLAQNFFTSVGAIMAVNPGINPANLTVGRTICIPLGGRIPGMQPCRQQMPIGTGAQPQPPTGTGVQPQPPTGTGVQPQPPTGTGTQPPTGTGAQPPMGTGARPQTPPAAPPQPVPAQPPQLQPGAAQPVLECISTEEQSLVNYLRLLWSQHVYWTRMLVISAFYNLPDAEAVSNRLAQNPGDFEMVLRPLYGDEDAAQFADLLTAHLQIGNEVAENMASGNTAAADDAEGRWYDNADQIALFLADINPNWTSEEWSQMLYDHLMMLKSEFGDIIAQDFEDGISMFGNIEQGAMEMADQMARGIAIQFPQYFGM